MLLSKSLRKQLEESASEYQTALRDAPVVHQYLQGRGLTGETALSYRLGYVAQPLPGDGDYVNRLAIPYMTADGSVVDVRYRSLTDSGPKYLSRPNATARLFSVRSLLAPTDTMYITEGEIDAITLNQIGLPAVGIPGANQYQKHWSLLFADFDTVKVICDGDQAGRDFGKRLAQEIEGATVIHLPEGRDANDIYVNDGEEALRQAVSA
jgi:DNA primase